MKVTFGGIPDLLAGIGTELGPSDWLVMTQERVDRFADATEDRQWIHVDPERAEHGPFGATIAHGFLSLSLVPYFVGQVRRIDGVTMGINYGLDRVRFPAPVRIGNRVRGHSQIRAVEKIDARTVQLVMRTTLEVQGGEKPCCVADLVSRLHF